MRPWFLIHILASLDRGFPRLAFSFHQRDPMHSSLWDLGRRFRITDMWSRKLLESAALYHRDKKAARLDPTRLGVVEPSFT